MVAFYAPPRQPDIVLEELAKWFAHMHQFKVTLRIEYGVSDSTSIFDGRAAATADGPK